MASLYLVTHFDIGNEFLKTCQFVFGELPLKVNCLAMNRFDNTDSWVTKLREDVTALNQHNDGVLIVTDLYGATPSNIAQHVPHSCPHKIISGLNLPMLFKIFNYAHLSLAELASKAIDGGQDGIIIESQRTKEQPL